MNMNPEDILSEYEIENAFVNIPFPLPKRNIINRACIAIAAGIFPGGTVMDMLKYHGLIDDDVLSMKGRSYLWAVYGGAE